MSCPNLSVYILVSRRQDASATVHLRRVGASYSSLYKSPPFSHTFSLSLCLSIPHSCTTVNQDGAATNIERQNRGWCSYRRYNRHTHCHVTQIEKSIYTSELFKSKYTGNSIGISRIVGILQRSESFWPMFYHLKRRLQKILLIFRSVGSEQESRRCIAKRMVCYFPSILSRPTWEICWAECHNEFCERIDRTKRSNGVPWREGYVNETPDQFDQQTFRKARFSSKNNTSSGKGFETFYFHLATSEKLIFHNHFSKSKDFV